MSRIIVVSILYLVFGIILYMSYLSGGGKGIKKNNSHASFIILAAAALAVRYIAAAAYPGHTTDMGCFSAWADKVFKDGFSKFYTTETFTDYPPGYMYVLWILGAVKNVFSMQGGAFYVLLKTPAVICDVLIGALIYRLACKKDRGAVAPVCAALWLFNPAVVLNSAVWGQVDSVFTLFVLICVLLAEEEKLCTSFFVFAIAVTIKPQSLFYAPILALAAVEKSIYPKFDKKLLVKYIAAAAGAVLLMFIVAAPFGITNVIAQYTDTVTSYPYASVNAFNLWAALGLNWSPLTAVISAAGTVFVATVIVLAAVIFLKCKDRSKYFWLSGFICFFIFLLANRMHDRYAYPAMVMFLAAFISNGLCECFITYIAVSITQFINAAYVLFFYDAGSYHSSSQGAYAAAFGFLTLICGVIAAYTIKICAFGGKVQHTVKTSEKHTAAVKAKVKNEICPSGKNYKMSRKDWMWLIPIIAVYSAIALFNLGDMQAPQNGVTLNNSEKIVTLDKASDIKELKVYLGSYNLSSSNKLEVSFENEQGEEVLQKSFDKGSVFFWNEYDTPCKDVKSVKFKAAGKVIIMEAALVSENGDTAAVSDGGELFDEQDMVPEQQTFKNSTYFDEIYHARTAYEFIHRLSVYEWTHPPLGKVFIAIGVKLFGMTPFGWRIAGTVFGIFMIPAIYLFAKKMFGKTSLSAFCTVLFTFDFMHFAQTRIATIDVYITFFIILMYLFMVIYYRMNFYDTDFKKTLVPLGACGICFGLGTASKWTGIYAGAGLALIFALCMIRRYSEYKAALAAPKGVSDGIKNEYIIKVFTKYLRNTVLFCVVFFVLIPAGIYLLSYIPFMNANQTGIEGVLQNQKDMFFYHKDIVDTHAYSSRWYQWPIMYRPIWYYSGTVSDKIKEGISSFGNPLVWWAGIPAFFFVLYCACEERDKNAIFLSIGYLAQLLPWIPVTRITFIYHYFPCVPFVAMMITYCADKLIFDEKRKVRIMIGYAIAAVVLFAMFYPVLSGYPVSVDYVHRFLKWSSQWVLVSGA